MPSLLDAVRSAGADADSLYDAFLEWTLERGIELYPAQDEAVMELVQGNNVILATPTGTGKSLVATAAHAIALGRSGRTYYTAPIKALVSEKFFSLVEIFGAENVGLVTGDSSVNGDAPIVCCTAEILANLALREGESANVDQVVMDEFHYYGDRDRGWAWQVPLLLLPRAQFLLMSATLGDTTMIERDLTRRTGRETTLVAGAERPVPLHFSYEKKAAHEVVENLLQESEVPVYVVHFSQAQAMERAQALSSINVTTRPQRDEIAEAIGDFRFTTNFGKTLSRLVRAGIGVHHAGMLPRYRRLVETLAQRGLLRVICGTDTLGVGINVPIRTVLVTALSKYDGSRMRRLGAREFHQIAGRAGRAGFDPYGNVVVLAPEHEIENEQAMKKAGDDPKKRKKVQKKQAPKGFVSWSEQSFEKIIEAEPEALSPQMHMTSAILINIIARGGDVFGNVRSLVFDNHQPRRDQYALARRALAIFRTLRDAELVEIVDGNIRLVVELQANFALNQPLSPFALAAIELLDPDEGDGGVGSGSYALDVVSIIESTLDNPRAILSQQEYKARGEAVGAMKRDGIEYEERMELLEEITYPKPLDDLLTQAFETFATSQPWVRDFPLSPKSIVRDMFERAMTFADFVQWYQLARSEGLVLRYLSDAFRAIRQTVPAEAHSEELDDIVEWLGEMIRQVDSSLVDEWETLVAGADQAPGDGPVVPPAPPSIVKNERAFTVLVRNAMFRRVQLAALEKDDELEALDPEAGWPEALDAYFAEHNEMLTGGAARAPQMCRIEKGRETWLVEQTIDDPEGNHDWRLTAMIDLQASADEAEAVLADVSLARL
ncbi:DEAD/DEAH box helicase [Microbacterium amylolyticum]|uniref:Superfamily II RNA helicase n=1 Tax=Microbacterium amylolyticum TaxID=936337 RepID=A0ABS4ZGF4_9MICO|nr:DEAD/DEAH box helicase [Microbacterium amylolyticum]MBP2436359.1 superfamily II RNA helicase [Microbacterium amylolyticum]